MAVPYDDLDPGIRRVVRWLNANGFETLDSGDGVSKFGEDGKPLPDWEMPPDAGFECVMPHPHVVMAVAVAELGPECDRLRDLLVATGIPVSAIGPEDSDIAIQGTYDPCLEDHPAYIMLMGLGDAAFAKDVELHRHRPSTTRR